MVNPVKKTCKPGKVVDEYNASGLWEKGIIREEVWQDSQGKVVKYNLAFINHSLRAEDDQGVLGYGNSHDHHHRHEPVERFQYDVRRLRDKKEPVRS